MKTATRPSKRIATKQSAAKQITVKKVVQKRQIIDANTPLSLHITEEHHKKAKCGDPGQCVIAQALYDHFGPAVDGFQVGGSITRIRMDTRIIRYSTGAKLRKALIGFDKTGKWNLPPGWYTLRPLDKAYRRGSRWDKKKKSGGKRSVYKGQSVPTRKALTACQLAAL
jgi:hypothetical protein